MHRVAPPRSPMHPSSEEEQRLVRDELAALLQSPHFSNSKRYPALLSYVVEKALAGSHEGLKERVLGVEVFHRPPDYDSNSDTVVRVAAGEVRRRLALVYHESENEHAVEIVLPAGSYVPEFYRINSQEMLVSALPSEPPPSFRRITPPGFNGPIAALTPLRPIRRKAVVVLALVILVAGFAAFSLKLRARSRQTSVDLFWESVRDSSGPVIICPSAMVRDATNPYGLAIAHKTDEYTFTSTRDVLTLADLVGLFSKSHIDYIVQPTSAITLTDMSEHPVILIGAYNNEWTNRLQNDLRYRFAPGPSRQIYDGLNPSTTWVKPASLPLEQEDDFAIVGRFHSKLTDNLVVIIAGIGANGTDAAAQFVTTPRFLDLLNQRLSKGWDTKNVEVVLKAKVIDGKSAAPTIEAAYVW
jgi:hypothetical protein